MEKNGTPLHDAASRGDLDLVKEIYEKTPHLAQATDNRRRLPLHLASAGGYTDIVRLFVLNDHLDMCSARDADRSNPLHLAAMNGKVEVLNVLVQKSPCAAEARAGRGETILHVCFKYNHKEAITLLLENAKIQELVNGKDDDGNSLLHLVVADQNATFINNEIVKNLLACPNIDVSAINSHKETPLDIAIKREQRLKKLKLDKKVAVSLVNALRVEDARTVKELGRINWLAEKRSSLMVVASLIATMAFQAGVTPPGGVFQDEENGHYVGDSVMAVSYPYMFARFLWSNTTAVLGSLTVILLLISELPFKNKFFMWALTIIMWGTITAIAYSYGLAISTVIPTDGAPVEEMYTPINIGVLIWISIMGLLLLIHTIRICLRLRKVRNLKFYMSMSKKKLGFGKRNSSGPGGGASVNPV